MYTIYHLFEHPSTEGKERSKIAKQIQDFLLPSAKGWKFFFVCVFVQLEWLFGCDCGATISVNTDREGTCTLGRCNNLAGKQLWM